MHEFIVNAYNIRNNIKRNSLKYHNINVNNSKTNMADQVRSQLGNVRRTSLWSR